MKIIGGKLKGRNFFMPKGTRPTPDIVRKALFDILGQDLTGLSFIDLFAGSGAVGLEAISRNAKRVMFVESDSRCCEIISQNLTTLGITPYETPRISFHLLNTDVFAAVKQLSKATERFDIVFIDPPYYRELAKKTLKTLVAYDIVCPTCFIALQHDKREILPATEGRFLIVKQRKYGSSVLTVYKNQDT